MDSGDDPDIYDVDVVAWDYGLTPLHFAILDGRLEAIELLVSEYGANVHIPVVRNGQTEDGKTVVLSMVLCLHQSTPKMLQTASLLLKLGAKPGQADAKHVSLLHSVAAAGKLEIVKLLLRDVSTKTIINTVGFAGPKHSEVFDSPLSTSVGKGYDRVVTTLLEAGAKPHIDFDEWHVQFLRIYPHWKNYSQEHNLERFRELEQPVIVAAVTEAVKIVEQLVANGADVNTLTPAGNFVLRRDQQRCYHAPQTLLDIIQHKIKIAKDFRPLGLQLPEALKEESAYTLGFREGSFLQWSAISDFRLKQRSGKKHWEIYNEAANAPLARAKLAAIEAMVLDLERLEESLIQAGAKQFYQRKLHAEPSRLALTM